MKPLPVFPAGHPGEVGVGTVEVMMEVGAALVVLGLSHSASLVEVAVGAGVLATHRGAIGFNSVLHTS